jgi:hypothetical protein
LIKKIVVILTLIIVIKNYGQSFSQRNLDSLFNHYVLIKTGQQIVEKPIHLSTEQRKCGFGLAASVVTNFDKFSSYQKSILKNLFQRPITDTSITTPSGFFRIHYNKTGVSAPAYSIQELAKALDSVYNFEVNFLVYPPPPPDNGMGGDNKYDVYISNLGGDYYGYTQPETSIGNDRYTSFIVIDNDYFGYPTSGINGAKVTVAHEFYHAIQIGNYIYREADIFYYEISSTAMEEFVFDDINDYYHYIEDYFNNPSRPFSVNNGYNLAIWNLFLQKNFGFGILKRIWDLMPTNRALISIAIAINEKGSTFKELLNKFAIWNYFTGTRSIPGKYYKEAFNYPLIKTSNPMPFTPPSRSYSMRSRATTNYYLKINSGLDTLIVILSNSDIASGIDSTEKTFPFVYTLYSDTSRGNRKLGGIFSAEFETLNPSHLTFFGISEILNDLVISGDTTFYPTLNQRDLFVFPNPFYFNKDYLYGGLLNIQFNKTLIIDEIELYVYSSSMQLVYNDFLKLVFLPNGARGVKWNLKDNNGNPVPSGIYFVITKFSDKVFTEKVVIFNE